VGIPDGREGERNSETSRHEAEPSSGNRFVRRVSLVDCALHAFKSSLQMMENCGGRALFWLVSQGTWEKQASVHINISN
jgi:hypothetical protein